MCATCGCSDHESDHPSHDHGLPDHSHEPAPGAIRLLSLQADVLGKNQRFADANRRRAAQRGLVLLNVVSSPGAGKTTLLVETIKRLQGRVPVAVIEGDQYTRIDADRIAATGVHATQINTGKVCHLDAHGVGHAIDGLALPRHGVVFIENVGNLVCPAEFDLGETKRVVLLSVAEGDDKPLKYANIFASADLLLITKLDLLPYVSFDLDRCAADARKLNAGIEIQSLSAKTGEGMQAWCDWLSTPGSPPLAAAARGEGFQTHPSQSK